jgi:hypothetical protein
MILKDGNDEDAQKTGDRSVPDCITRTSTINSSSHHFKFTKQTAATAIIAEFDSTVVDR